MIGKKFIVGSCDSCSNIVLAEVNFLEFEDKCCTDIKNLKIMKIFNDINEAKNYIERHKEEDY